MAKVTNKKSLLKKWNEKISKSERIYKDLRKKDKSLPGWEKSDIYKEFKKRKKRSLMRYERRDEINERRREVYKLRKEGEKLKDEFSEVSESSVFEAYTGDGRAFENTMREIVKDKKSTFFGEIFIDTKRDSSFAEINRYSFRVNSILRKIFNKKGKAADSYAPMQWMVKRSYFYDVEINHLFVSHEFFTPDYDETKPESNDESEG